MKFKKILIVLIMVILLVGVVSAPYIVSTRTPVKYAIRLEDIWQHPNCIIVKEAFHTGTGWEQIGNDSGLFVDTQKEDVYLTGKLPPNDALGEYYNTFVCEVQHTGQYTQLSPDVFEQYEIVEWYPLYPVKRNSLLPSWFYPKAYLSESDNVE